jgi:hypothetical protein
MDVGPEPHRGHVGAGLLPNRLKVAQAWTNGVSGWLRGRVGSEALADPAALVPPLTYCK